jgi:hypothetical protein
MKITITGNRKVADIQKDFNLLFPFLNLEFFDLAEDKMVSYTSSGRDFPQLCVKDIRGEQKDGELVVGLHMTVMQLEHILSEEFGLQAEVFERSGNQWMRYSLNGYWTLYHKNEAGRRTAFRYHSNY